MLFCTPHPPLRGTLSLRERDLPQNIFQSEDSVLAVEFVQGNFAVERIPMQAEKFRGGGLITFSLLQSQLYELLFELSDCFFEINALFDHLGNQLVQLLSHEYNLYRCSFHHRSIAA
jgi:hypothetical protein